MRIPQQASYGYLLACAPPLVLLVGTEYQLSWLLFLSIFVLGPLTRSFIGNISFEAPLWEERDTALLEAIPRIAAGLYFVALPLAQWRSSLHASELAATAGQFLSEWAAMFCAIPVAHELMHKTDVRRTVGNALAGFVGYPALEGEHILHHSLSGAIHIPEWPARRDSVWKYTLSRSIFVYARAFGLARGNLSYARRLTLALLCTALAAAIAFAARGTPGMLGYLGCAMGINFAVHVINYIQHWGLGIDNLVDASEGRYGWECRCRLQGWILLNIAVHHTHHQNSSLPYYHIVPSENSPKLPGSYIPLFFISLVPSVWKSLMNPFLDQWIAAPNRQIEPRGKRILCLPRWIKSESDVL